MAAAIHDELSYKAIGRGIEGACSILSGEFVAFC
ncbi:hypothetical protein ABIF50_009320 [Bradyrhizobium diazoefficiens]